jgi:hypothetical protein
MCTFGPSRSTRVQEQKIAVIVFRQPSSRRLAMVTKARETGNLIGSDKVEGTAVYGPDD